MWQAGKFVTRKTHSGRLSENWVFYNFMNGMGRSMKWDKH